MTPEKQEGERDRQQQEKGAEEEAAAGGARQAATVGQVRAACLPYLTSLAVWHRAQPMRSTDGVRISPSFSVMLWPACPMPPCRPIGVGGCCFW